MPYAEALTVPISRSESEVAQDPLKTRQRIEQAVALLAAQSNITPEGRHPIDHLATAHMLQPHAPLLPLQLDAQAFEVQRHQGLVQRAVGLQAGLQLGQ